MGEKMTEREAFEKWAESERLSLPRCTLFDLDSYASSGTRIAWLAWQARVHLTQPAQAVDVGALKHLVLSWRERENALLAKNDDLSASKSLAYERCADDLDRLLTAALPNANGKDG